MSGNQLSVQAMGRIDLLKQFEELIDSTSDMLDELKRIRERYKSGYQEIIQFENDLENFYTSLTGDSSIPGTKKDQEGPS